MLLDLSLPFNLDSPDFKAFADKAQAKRVSALTSLGHFGTHLDRLKGTPIPLDYFKSRGICLDARSRPQDGKLGLGDLDLSLVMDKDFLIIRTGVMESHPYPSEGYMSALFELGWDLLEAMLDKGVRFIGLDSRGLRADRDHPKADTTCETRGAFVIENLTGLERLPLNTPITVYAAVLDLGGTGLPAKVVAELA
ncbi:MAG: cyclase family protein [Deltaproteobacteria bacterium]|jgi:kynurenine formamidase|nr:cyclase family protein [Deltaproteobacteria bacterium]